MNDPARLSLDRSSSPDEIRTFVAAWVEAQVPAPWQAAARDGGRNAIRKVRTRAEYEAWLNDALAAQAKDQQLPFATVDRATGDVVGSTRIFFFYPPDRRVEIGGTWLAPSAQRTPINTESKLLLLTHCFDVLRCVRVELKTDARNTNSRHAIARIGAMYEGVMRKHMLTRGGYHRDSVYYAIVDDDWPDVRRRLEELLATPRA